MLVEHGWDVELAYEALRKKGLAAAAKKASRHAAEGLVGASFAASGTAAAAAGASGGSGSVVVVELNSETDFVARNELFQGLLREVLAATHSLGRDAAVGPDHQLPLEQVLQARTPSGASVADAVTDVAAKVRENVRLRRAYRVDGGPGGLVYSYVHQAAAPGLGKLASVVVLGTQDAASSSDSASSTSTSTSASASASTSSPSPPSPLLAAAGEGLAMHVAGMRPAYLTRAHVPPEDLERERGLMTAQLAQDPAFRNKAPKVLSQIVSGRLDKLLADWCLAEQRYVMDEAVTVDGLVARLRKECGRPVRVASFLRVQCGEGLGPREGGDFAAEVAKIVSDT